MDLDNIMPKNLQWRLSKKRVFVKNIAWCPIFDIVDESQVLIFFDLRIFKPIIKILKNLMNNNIKFLFN